MKAKFWSLAALGIFITPLTALALAYPPPTFTAEYAARSQALEEKVQALLPIYVSSLEKIFGRTWPKQGKQYEYLRIELTDGPNFCGDSAACTGSRGKTIVLGLRKQFFLSGSKRIETTFLHELIHAYFRYFMNQRSYGSIPAWAKEGSAIYLSSQLEEHLTMHLHQSPEALVGPPNLVGIVNPLQMENYYEYALIFEYIDKTSPNAVVKLLKLLLKEKTIGQALAEIGLGSVAQLDQDSRTYIQKRLQTRREELPADLIHAAELMYSKPEASPLAQLAKARPYLENVLQEAGISFDLAGNLFRGGSLITGQDIAPHIGLTLRWLAEATRMANLLPTAAALYRILDETVRPVDYSFITASIHYERALISLKLGQISEAHTLFQRVYGEHIETPNLQLGAVKGIALTHFAEKRYAQALEWIRPDRYKFADLEKWAIFAIGIYHTEDREAGKAEFEKLLKSISVDFRRREYIEIFFKHTGEKL